MIRSEAQSSQKVALIDSRRFILYNLSYIYTYLICKFLYKVVFNEYLTMKCQYFTECILFDADRCVNVHASKLK